MDKKSILDKLKGKSYYVLLLVGVIAIAVVSFVGTRFTSKEEKNDFTKLNEIIPEKENTNNKPLFTDENKVGEKVKSNTNDDVVKKNDDLIEFDIYAEKEEKGIDISKDITQNDKKEEEKEIASEEAEALPVDGKTVEAKKIETIEQKLEFNVDNGLSWPIKGDILMKYSMDSTIYHDTLMVFKCNPAIIIGAEEGSQVLAATDGKVIKLDKNEEIGMSVTIDIGSQYNLVYGQLEKVEFAVGDMVKEGDVIGFISKPTKYYTLEGSNLYFQVLKEDAPVNPLAFLKD